MVKRLLTGLVMIAIAGMPAIGAGGETISPLGGRTSEKAITSDLATFDRVQNRLIALNEQGVPSTDYFWAKAQAWLDFAYDEYTENDRTGIERAALNEAVKLIVQIEAGAADIDMSTSLLHGTKQREDLWKLAAELKGSPGFRPAAPYVARLEVLLVQYAHEVAELGWRHARDLLALMEDLAEQAKQRVAGYRVRLATGVIGHGRIGPEPDNEDYPFGETIALNAIAGPGWFFQSWQGAASGGNSPVPLAMRADASVTAVFQRRACRIEMSSGDGGRVQVEMATNPLLYGDPVTVAALAAPGWAFDHWEGDMAGQSNPAYILMTGDLFGSAVFRPIDYTIAPRIVGDGAIDFQPEQRYYRFGDQVAVQATAAAGWQFDHWEDALFGEANPSVVRVDSSRILTAVFHPLPTAKPTPSPDPSTTPTQTPKPSPTPTPTPTPKLIPTPTPKLTPTPAPKPVLRLPVSVHFALNKYFISPMTAKVLDGVAKAMTDHPDIHLTLVGHADIQGNAPYNMELSRQRVEAVCAYMISIGVPLNRMGTSYVGDTQPILPGRTPRDYARNRSVELSYKSESIRIETYEQEEDFQL